MRLGTGVVNAFTRGPAVLAQHAAALQDACGGRFCLGIGSSSNVIVERWNEIPFEKPLTKVRETVEVLRAVLGGERGPGGFKLETPPEVPPPIYIAALRGRMLRLGGALGDGTFVNFLPLSGVETVMAEIRAGEREAGKPEGSSDVLCRFFCIPQPAGGGDCRSRAGCSPPTRPCRSTRRSSAGSAGARRSTRWSRPGGPATAQRAREAGAGGADPRDLHLRLAGRAEGAARGVRAGGITTPVLTPICGPDELPAMIDSLAP